MKTSEHINSKTNYSIPISLNSFSMNLALSCYKNGKWHFLKNENTNNWKLPDDANLDVTLNLTKNNNNIDYKLVLTSIFDTQIRLSLSLNDENDFFHLIPANIFGDNNIEKAHAGEYPVLSNRAGEYCSDFWEFRADRASLPVSILCCRNGAVGVSVTPYTTDENKQLIRNGVFAGLPNQFGISLGYTNDPFTFVNKRHWEAPTFHRCKITATSGKIYAVKGNGRQTTHTIIRELYETIREVPIFKKTYKEAVKGLFDSLINVNFSKKFNDYTNMLSYVPNTPKLESWRPLVEIGWTGGGVIAYPLMTAAYTLNMPDTCFKNAKSPHTIFEEIIKCYNKKSGLLNDITKPRNPEQSLSNVNGWWTDFPLTKDCHCAYTNGSAAFYLIKAYEFEKKYFNRTNDKWLKTALKVLDTVISLQRDDGAYGYTYKTDTKEVVDWEGFAGCWFTAACAYAYRVTENTKFLTSAKKSLDYYSQFVKNLSCWGTPMDTWKSVDEEGNLAFVRAARLLHETTNERYYLQMLEMGANYEYLWRYGFRAEPEFPPLKGSDWNSCGGSFTSVSNPHLHPMAMLIADDLDYLSKTTGDCYHKKREEDSIAFIMNTMELYPKVSGYGQYGVLTERFCPSDGLVIEKFEDGTPSSMWFTYNGWAAANTLEAIAQKVLRQENINYK